MKYFLFTPKNQRAVVGHGPENKAAGRCGKVIVLNDVRRAQAIIDAYPGEGGRPCLMEYSLHQALQAGLDRSLVPDAELAAYDAEAEAQAQAATPEAPVAGDVDEVTRAAVEAIKRANTQRDEALGAVEALRAKVEALEAAQAKPTRKRSTSKAKAPEPKPEAGDEPAGDTPEG